MLQTTSSSLSIYLLLVFSLTAVKKPMSMTSLYLDPISIEPNVDVSKDCPATTNVMENVEAYETRNKPRSITTLSKYSMIVADRDDVNKNIRVLISQVLGIAHKTNVVSDVSTSLAQPDNNTENPIDMANELGNKDKNLIDQPTGIVNIEELDSDDVHIGKRLAPGISKRLKNRKGQAVGSSNPPFKSVKNKASVGSIKRWSEVVTPVSKKKSLKRKEVPYESSESDHDVEHNV